MKTDTSHFWRNHLEWFIPFVSEYYPLSKLQLIQYEELLDWERITRNEFINWTDDVIQCFSDKLPEPNGHTLFYLEEMPVVVHYQSKEDPVYRTNDIEDYLERWKQIQFGLYIPEKYNEDAVMLLIRKFNCTVLLNDTPLEGLPIPTSFIEEKKETLDWGMLSRYWGLKWMFELLQQYEDFWVTKYLIENATVFNYCLKESLDDAFIEKVLD